MKKTITIRLDADLAEKLDVLAASARRSRSDIIRTVLRRRLETEFHAEADQIIDDSYPTLDAVSVDSIVSEPQTNPIKEKSFVFALEIVNLYQQLQDQREYVLSKQILRSGTSIGANVEEATAAESRADFIHKMKIAMKESRETHYWLRLLDQSEIAGGLDLVDLLSQADELSRMLTSITKTASENARRRS